MLRAGTFRGRAVHCARHPAPKGSLTSRADCPTLSFLPSHLPERQSGSSGAAAPKQKGRLPETALSFNEASSGIATLFFLAPRTIAFLHHHILAPSRSCWFLFQYSAEYWNRKNKNLWIFIGSLYWSYSFSEPRKQNRRTLHFHHIRR